MESIAISMDGHTAALHDDSRGVSGTFEKVLTNLPKLRRAGLHYNAMSTVTSHNVGHLVEIVDFLEARGFVSVNFILLNFSGMAREDGGHFSTWQTWQRAFLDLTHELATRRRRIEISVLPPHEDPIPYEMFVPLRDAGELDLLESVWGIPYRAIDKSDGIGCAAGKTQMTVFENGDVFGCELMRDNPGFQAGNVRNAPLREIWESSIVFERLRAMKKKDLKGTCGTCTLDVCGGGCRASAFNTTSLFDGSDANCHLHRREPTKRFLPVVA
jgi:radical SAM protein with 4Fe4S-binding SPASM domain